MGTKDNSRIMVAIECMVFNHEPYIRQCLEGFIMQKTNFRFVAIVHDDASTDSSASIIREYEQRYPNIIHAIYETQNQYSKHDESLSRIMLNAVRGTDAKYIAICEGDDYWTDPLKLQKQVDYLEGHPEVSLVYTGFNNVNEKSIPIVRPYYEFLRKHSKSGDIFHQLIYRNFIMNLTVCFRSDIRMRNTYINNPVPFYDYGLFLAASIHSKIKYFPEIMGNYRQTPGSLITSHKSEVNKKLSQVRLYFAQCFLKGEGFKRSWRRNRIIEYNIVKGFLFDKSNLYKLYTDFPYLRLYQIPCSIEHFIIRVLKKLHLISKFY